MSDQPTEAEQTLVRHWQNHVADFSKDLQAVLNQCDTYRKRVAVLEGQLDAVKKLDAAKPEYCMRCNTELPPGQKLAEHKCT